ncbi:putative mediator complex subunit 31 [Tieghemostelium lacteum]|uniref:Mediator of RNA polymerase II transcription subunit 31 n=1 Tax=Tieghemostelium lacteum TaxID=361077 RepID=A0A151ZRQ8_TIELA|nr:putative mediator complex subunit 31 [Tieghemostelium lacteum]|eukprot:KYQ96711.1 putative mediator complex subunit 31 [Tieghemostelium lacteum]
MSENVNNNNNINPPTEGGEEEEANSLRFIMELEFVQCLSNPKYLNFLAQNRYFQDKAFINYLSYLLYWKKPKYAKYIVYPQCLYFLDLIQEERFRQELNHFQSAEFIHQQQFYHWQYYRNNRMAIKEEQQQQQQQNQPENQDQQIPPLQPQPIQ